jgi:endonuclease YncB( thermonuclease family)
MGADVTEADADGATPLHAAAFAGHASAIELLLDAGARLNSRDRFGFTPLHAAARDGRMAAAKALVARGADLEALDETGLTPAEVAAFMNHREVAEWLAARRPPSLAEQAIIEPHAEEPIALVDVDLAVQPLATGEMFRVWTSVSGAKVEAEFVQNVLDSVLLRRRDASLVRIPLGLLTPEDQAIARRLSGQAAPILSRASGRSATPRPADESIGLRIGRAGGWTVLENCRLLRRSGNDGDSFHIAHDGKEYIIRLYYADAPETDLSHRERVREQAEYFDIDEQDLLRLGKEASRFTERILARGPFTVVTKWEDARGNSRLPRHFGLVITELGDLDELLMAEGLVRLHGMRIDGPGGSQKYQTLKRLEQTARRERVGAWGVGREARAEAL